MSEKSDLTEEKCQLCRRYDNDINRYGEKVMTILEKRPPEEIVVHLYCLLTSPGFSQGGVKMGDKNEGIKGYLPREIKKEIDRAKKLSCLYCKKRWAANGCHVSKCRATYHTSCAIDATLSPDNNQWVQLQMRKMSNANHYQSWCWKHAKKHAVKFIKPSNITRSSPSFFKCSFCSDPIDRRLIKEAPIKIIQCFCCKSFCHMICARDSALMTGKKHFKCLSCHHEGRCKDRFIKNCQDKGVYVPSQAKRPLVIPTNLKASPKHESMETDSSSDQDKPISTQSSSPEVSQATHSEAKKLIANLTSSFSSTVSNLMARYSPAAASLTQASTRDAVPVASPVPGSSTPSTPSKTVAFNFNLSKFSLVPKTDSPTKSKEVKVSDLSFL